MGEARDASIVPNNYREERRKRLLLGMESLLAPLSTHALDRGRGRSSVIVVACLWAPRADPRVYGSFDSTRLRNDSTCKVLR